MKPIIITEVKQLLTHMQMQDDMCKAIINYMKQHCSMIETRASQAYLGELPMFPITNYKPMVRLTVIVLRLLDVHKRFQQHDIPDNIFYATIQDITLRANLYYEKTHTYGLSKADSIWYRHIFNFHIFKLGVLQFQYFHMIYLDQEGIGQDYMQFREEDKRKLPPGIPVINVHVQTKADLTPVLVEESFKEAALFFQTFFPEHQPQAFLCYSWLLYPDNKVLLPANSQILHFAKQFTVISQKQIADEAIKRIYGKRYRHIKDYPQNTLLQRNALHHFSMLGEACGIRFITDS